MHSYVANREVQRSVLDGVLSTQSELGPKIPDGGYGWVVFAATIFFQMFIPSLIVVFGILLESSKMINEVGDKTALYLWDDKLICVPLFFTLSWIMFDPTARNLISHSTWPRLIGQAGNCLTCAGLLFIWIGMAGNQSSLISAKLWYVLAGLVSGIGSSIQIAQCEILLAQYFKLKHLKLTHATHMVIALGFIGCPILVGHLLMQYKLLQVILIYQAILLLGLLISMIFKKPAYLKSKLVRYHYVMENGEDEEDIFSKSLTELKVKTKDVLKKIELKNDVILNEVNTASTSNDEDHNKRDENRKDWVKFHDEEHASERKSWERFEEDNGEQINSEQNGNELKDGKDINTNNPESPASLFNELNVNMNTSYAFDDDNFEYGPRSIPSVFPELERNSGLNLHVYMRFIKMPTFYKSLLTIITTKYSIFMFYALFPTYLYVEISHLKFKKSAMLVGALSLGTLLFSGVSYWLNVNKQKRPIFFFLLCWIGANGYFLIATYKHSEYVVLFGALEIVLSIASLQHTGGPLLALTIRGESNSEYFLLSMLTGLSFLIFLIIDLSYKDCFLLMALLHIITGLVWVFNFSIRK
ncbi:hypothetical protein HHI36_002552 [Cryptolaemus montrouzieri]|uniref:Uncharacterized protein n=1 Tax=Cryptolaemus montrouzieri TaxID=559131 RepID=A0ABD2PBN0_9CUCU